jgi:hypothetical protein
MARGSTPAQPLPVASAVRSIAAIDPSLDPPFDDVEIEVDIAEPTDLVNLLDLAIAGTSGAEPPPRKTVLGVAVPAAASPAASEPAPRAADETTGRDRVVAMVIDPALEAMTPTEMGRPPIPSPATASSPRPFASATRSANPSAANPMGSGARAPSGVVSTFARITPAAPGAALPSGDWTIALDPGAPDGWTAPVPTVGSRAATGAEHLPPASRGDALPPPEPKVQVDPTLIEPLHGALSEELMRSASEPPRPIGYAATGAADARGDAGPGPAAAQGPGATGYASAAGYAGAMGGAPGGSSAGGTGYPGAGAPSFGGAAADAIGAGAAGYADAGGTREPEAGAAGYAVAMGYADAANASYAAAAGGYPVAAAVGYAGAGAGGYANAGAGGHASPGAAVPVAIDPSPQSQPQSHPSAQPQPPSQPSIPSHSTVHPSLHPGFQPSQSLPPFPPLQASLPTPLPTDSFPPPYRSPMHPTEAPAYALDPSYQMVPAGVPSPGSVADGSFAVPRHSATMLSARGRRRRLVIVIASAALVIAIGVVALAMLSGKPDDAPRGNRAPRVPTSVVPRPTQTTLGSATAAPGSAPTPESAPAMRDDHTAGAPSAASAPATGATTPTGGCFADVSSTPSGAEIVVDDAVLGTTPQAVPLPCGAPVDLEIRKAHLVAVTRTVTPAPGHVKVRVALTKQLALIKVSSAPEGATVTLNGRSLGVTPTTVKVPALESSTLTITKPGYETQTERVSPRSSGTSVRVQLRRPEH